ncbi:hypothetical protein EDB92DRAFT_1939317 [Lactarius akahatsu]|uniref:Uncharacterized protein n=1 Tax=Lactarius akahatsu TaxID=416441 RepID=A0AAD4LT98_9AGAM|nr:hypothetical protein EDB92DRAFT_1939317 [Lactarius akahatsu]
MTKKSTCPRNQARQYAKLPDDISSPNSYLDTSSSNLNDPSPSTSSCSLIFPPPKTHTIPGSYSESSIPFASLISHAKEQLNAPAILSTSTSSSSPLSSSSAQPLDPSASVTVVPLEYSNDDLPPAIPPILLADFDPDTTSHPTQTTSHSIQMTSHSTTSATIHPTPSMSQNVTMGPSAMPTPHSHQAPFYSDEGRDPLEDFLTEYKELATRYRLTVCQKVETILHYVSLELRDLWKCLDGYSMHNWAVFQHSLEEIYTKSSADNKYSTHKLLEFTKRTFGLHMSDEEDVRQYY